MPPSSGKLSRKQKDAQRTKRAAREAQSIAFVPLLIFAFSVIASVISYSSLSSSFLLYRFFTLLLSLSFTLSGLAHFYKPLYAFYASMVFLPWQSFWIYSTGLLMVASGLGLLFENTRAGSAGAVVFTLLLVFPGNLACVVSKHPRDVVCRGSMPLALARLPFQATYIRWAYWIWSGY